MQPIDSEEKIGQKPKTKKYLENAATKIGTDITLIFS
jgi:hypothetical protein